MDENSNFLDELARDAELESGDAKKAWQLLAISMTDSDLPTWVKGYVSRSAKAVEAFDSENGDQAALAHHLGFYIENETKPTGYDLDHILEWFTDRMMRDLANGQKINVSRTSREYKDENRYFNSSPNGIRKAYEKARNRLAKQQKSEIELEKLLTQNPR